MSLYRKLIDKKIISARGLLWKSSLDALPDSEMPQQFRRKSLMSGYQDDFDEYENLDEVERWTMAYWVERTESKRAFKYGLIFGFLFGFILVWIPWLRNFDPFIVYFIALPIVWIAIEWRYRDLS